MNLLNDRGGNKNHRKNEAKDHNKIITIEDLDESLTIPSELHDESQMFR